MSIDGGGALATGQVYTKQDSVDTAATIWSPCGATGTLNINNRLALINQQATQAGELSNDDATVAFTQQLHVAWQKCTPSSSTGGAGSGNPVIGGPGSSTTWMA